jgi:hypothetical protein
VDGHRFDELTRFLGVSLTRKRFLAFLGGLAAPIALTQQAEIATARKKGHKHHKGGGVEGLLEDTCGGTCTKDSECDTESGCVCDLRTNQCETLVCGGDCTKDAECSTLGGCHCEFPIDGAEERFGAEGLDVIGQCVTDACGGFCTKDADCDDSGGCICDVGTNQCVTVVCPGFCETNDDCTEQGQDNCVCFTIINIDSVQGELINSACGSCLGADDPCNASNECCGQLVCEPNSQSMELGFCQRKREPKKRHCSKHGGGCHSDHDCCAQGVCYGGKCGEKDTHCKSDSECARGFTCVGGKQTGSHRRCRRKGHKVRNKRNRGRG